VQQINYHQAPAASCNRFYVDVRGISCICGAQHVRPALIGRCVRSRDSNCCRSLAIMIFWCIATLPPLFYFIASTVIYGSWFQKGALTLAAVAGELCFLWLAPRSPINYFPFCFTEPGARAWS